MHTATAAENYIKISKQSKVKKSRAEQGVEGNT
jgi:hypothetical protein